MKKNRKFIVIAFLLCSVSFWLIINNRKSTIREELRDFGTSDTGAVVKIFIADKKGNTILLDKQGHERWLVNKKNLARPDAVKALMTTLHDMEVRSPVGKSGYNAIIKSIASTGIKVEVYNKEGLQKTFYVGGPTQDQLGTFMYLENSTVPFITHIPGFNGYLTPRFSTREEDWKIKNVFLLEAGELDELTVIDREREGFAFAIKQNGGNYQLKNHAGEILNDASQDKITSYLRQYKILNYEKHENSLSPGQKDSLLKVMPFRSIRLKYNDGKATTIDFWRRPVTEGTQIKENADGDPFKFDVDRMVGRINGDTGLVVVQYFSFEKLFVSPAAFSVPVP